MPRISLDCGPALRLEAHSKIKEKHHPVGKAEIVWFRPCHKIWECSHFFFSFTTSLLSRPFYYVLRYNITLPVFIKSTLWHQVETNTRCFQRPWYARQQAGRGEGGRKGPIFFPGHCRPSREATGVGGDSLRQLQKYPSTYSCKTGFLFK